MTSLKKLNFQHPKDVTTFRFSEKNPDWKKAANDFGDLPEIDFACCKPFRCLDKESIAAVKEVVEGNRHLAYANARAVTLRGVPQLQKWFGCEELEKIVSEIAGVELIAHLEQDYAHVNLQVAPKEGEEDTRVAVDDWHVDYVPFVFIVMISKTPGADGGKLCTDFGDIALEVGESVLVQGSHVKHMAEKAKDGNRITLIVSFAPKSLDYRDTTRVIPGQLPYSPLEPLGEQAVQHRFSRLSRQAARLAACDPKRDQAQITSILEKFKDDSQRWEQLSHAGN
jgi:hypothetical protein